MSNFDTALNIANNAHEGQLDKGGLPYILHPLHVASFFEGELKIIAILQDVIEDSAVTMADLENYGFSGSVRDVLALLTHDPKDSYEQYIETIGTDIRATAIKLRDLEHNMDLTRLKHLDEGCWPRLIRYHTAYKFLEQQ